jgi:hypothetical protein
MAHPYDEAYERSIRQPEKFWADAAEDVHWFRKWDRVLDMSRDVTHITAELILLVREKIGPVASFKQAVVVKRYPIHSLKGAHS